MSLNKSNNKIELPEYHEQYLMNNKGTLYHVVDARRFEQVSKLYTLCGYEFDSNVRVPNVVPKRTKLVCKRCLKSMGINLDGQYNAR